MEEYIAARPLEPLVFRKRGIMVSLNYYRVDDALWHDAAHLLTLSAASLAIA